MRLWLGSQQKPSRSVMLLQQQSWRKGVCRAMVCGLTQFERDLGNQWPCSSSVQRFEVGNTLSFGSRALACIAQVTGPMLPDILCRCLRACQGITWAIGTSHWVNSEPSSVPSCQVASLGQPAVREGHQARAGGCSPPHPLGLW